MPADAYAGHAADSTAKLANENPENVAPADRPNYDPADFTDQPGAAAREKGYPRHDGKAMGTKVGGPFG